MIKGIQAVRPKNIQSALSNSLEVKFKLLLETRGAGHCMRVADLDLDLMLALTQCLRDQVSNAQIYVLTESQDNASDLYVTSTKLVELRNPDENGALRSPLLVFVPNHLKTSSEDSFGIATFEQIDVGDAYAVLFEELLAALPTSLKDIVAEIKYLIGERSQHKVTDYQWLRYILSIGINDYDPCIVGAALYELNLIPDLTLHEDKSQLVGRLVSNVESVNLIANSGRSAIASVYELQLEGDDFVKRLATYLNEYDLSLSSSWLKNIVLDSANWGLSFDKWNFQFQRESVDSICIEVTDVTLPTISENETNKQLQPLIGQKVLTVGQGGVKKFGVSFNVDPLPQDVNGLAKFKAQVFSQDGDFVGLIKAAKVTKKANATINFTKLTGLSWDEGWHYVRVQAFEEHDELLPLIDTNGDPIPWGASKESEAGNRPNESELFYVIPAEEADVEPLSGRKPKDDSLVHGKLMKQFGALVEDGKITKAEIKEISWGETNSRAEELLNIQFKQLGGIEVPVSKALKSLEQRIIESPMTALGWRAEIKVGELQGDAVIEHTDWPTKGVESEFKAFKAAREHYLHLVKNEDLNLISVGHDFSTSSQEAKAYAVTYLQYLTAIYQGLDDGDSDSDYCLEDVAPLLRIDGLNITVWDSDGAAKQALLLGPTHPLRALWITGWSQLSEYWLKQSEDVAKELVLGARNGLINELALSNFPYVLPTTGGELLVAIDNLHPFWTVYGSAQEPEPQTLLNTLSGCLGVSKPNLAQQVQSGAYLATKFERYLIQHPYVKTLTINVFNGANAAVIADTLLALEKRGDLKHLRYDIRLFVSDPFASDVGSQLLALLDNDSSLKASEADRFSQASGSHLFPKLSVSVRATEDFLNNIDSFSAHLSLLFDVFPAEEVAVVDQAADERITPVHGLYQDYCVEYSEENGVVAWDRYTRHGMAKPVFGSDFTEPLSVLPKLMANMTAAVATGKVSDQHVPVVRLTLKPSERALLNQLHEISDWVFTVDRNLGIEFFDHGGKEGRPDYLIDHSPEMAANNGHNFVITSRSTTEIQALLSNTLERFRLDVTPEKSARILDALRALSGRLALKLVSNSASKAEALGLALSKMYLDYQGVFHNQVVVPLDAHLELYQEIQKSADELGDALSLKRTDLALFDLDAQNRTLRCNLVEVKCYSEVGDMASYQKLKETIAQQISQSERVLQQHFDMNRTSSDRPDRLIRTQKLCVLLEHYLKRSMRFGLLESEVFEEAKYLLRTLEQGYTFVVSRSAVIFDFQKEGRNVEKEVGIEYHRIGRDYILDLLEADTYALQALAEDEHTTTSLASLELTLPKLTDAAFIPKNRERSVTWDEIVSASESFKLSQKEQVIAESGVNLNDEKINLPVESTTSGQHSIKEPTIESNVGAVQETEGTSEVVTDDPIDRTVNPAPEAQSQPEVSVEPKAEAPKVHQQTAVDVIPPASVPYDIMFGVNGDSAQYGIMGEVSGSKVALDLNHTHTISLFGVQGGGKSYTLGTVVEMATKSIPAINVLEKELSTVIFHYSATQDYKPEFTSMIAPNDDVGQLEKLKAVYGADAASLDDVILLTPEEKLNDRIAEYPGITVHPLKFCSAELQASHWKFLMGAVGNQAAYIRQLGNIMRRNRRNLTLDGIRAGVESSNLSDAMKDLANMRLEFAEQYIDDAASISSLIKPGRMVIVDLRDEFIEKDEALGLFVVLLQLFSEAKYQGESFNKLIVFDECHKYIDSPDLVKGLVETVREMRHKGTSVMIASQDPPSVPVALIELSSQVLLHKFNSPAWLKHIQKANTALDNLTPEKLNNLNPGEAYIWSSKASDLSFTKQAFKIKCRPRVTKHGGDTVTAV